MGQKTVVFKGITYYLYPDSKRRSDRVYFSRQGKRLHRSVWEDAYGPIPEGQVIHHKNHDTLDNRLENLELVGRSEHARYHNQPGRRTWDLAHLGRIRPLAAAWHSSPEGIAWHQQHGREVAASRVPVVAICQSCGKTYKTIHPSFGRFCSNNCKSAWRRNSGIDDEQRVCPGCGQPFTVNRYARAQTCSRQCGAILRRHTLRDRAGL